MASPSNRRAGVAGKARTAHRSLEQSVLLLALMAGLPSGLILLAITWAQPYSFEVRWTVTTVVLMVWLGAAFAAYQLVQRALFLQANLLGALREGTIRSAAPAPGPEAPSIS